MKNRPPREPSDVWMRFTLLSLILYTPAFVILARTSGRVAGALVLIPVALGGWSGGIAGGVFAATVGCILSTLALRFVLHVPGTWLEVAFGRGGALGVAVTYVVGVVFGHVRDSILQMRYELDMRRQAEVRLRAREVRLRASESRLRESETGYRMLFEKNPLPMWVFDPETLAILAVNQAAVDAYGHDVDKFLSLTTIDLVLADHVDMARAWFQNDAGAGHRETGHWRHRARDETIIDVEVTTRAIMFAGRRAALASVADVTKVREVEGRLEHRANHDPLTALPNRAFYQLRVEAAFAAVAAVGGSSAVILIDLDGFKAINDNYGHASGDVVLRTIAQRLRDGLRAGDVAARLGGDEFALLLPEADQNAANEIASRLIPSISQPIQAGGHTFQVGASIGVALFPNHGQDVAEVLHQADMAMYAAKRTRTGLAVASIGPEPARPAQAHSQNSDMIFDYAQL